MYYYATHGRFPPWLIGIVFGAFILDYQQNPKKFKIKRQVCVSVVVNSNRINLFYFLVPGDSGVGGSSCSNGVHSAVPK